MQILLACLLTGSYLILAVYLAKVVFSPTRSLLTLLAITDAMRRLGIITFLAFVLVGLFIYPHTESYCFFNPTIDTQFAPGYSESAFKKIAVGDRKQTVRKLLGKPLEVREGSDGAEHWM